MPGYPRERIVAVAEKGLTVISHKFKTIFVHIPKCAGMSIETAFVDAHGLTWESRFPLLLTPNNNPDLGPPRLAHLKPAEYRRIGYAPEWMWREYFTFSFVRNPWHRVVSLYRYMRYDERCSFRTFVVDVLANELMQTKRWFVGQQVEWLLDEEGGLEVDFIGRVENIFSHFQIVRSNAGLPNSVILPHCNNSRVSGRKVYPVYAREADYYCDVTARVVEELYKDDCEQLGYSGPEDF